MKLIYSESIKKPNSEKISAEQLAKLPKEIFLAYSIQYKHIAQQLKRELEKNNIIIKGFRQVLGCSQLKSKFPILLIGSGRFHALNLAMQNKEVYIYNNSAIAKISKKDIENLKKNKQNNLNRFFTSSKIGIIISTKPGQQKLSEAKQLANKIEKKYSEKRVYLFISNNINTNEFENFQIDSWINTACPGLLNDSNKIINYDDILEFLK